MDLSESYTTQFKQQTLQRYKWAETRNAAAIMRATNPIEFDQLCEVLDSFAIDERRDVLAAGGNEGEGTKALNYGFRSRGWHEGDYTQTHTNILKLIPASDTEPVTEPSVTTTSSPSYLIDNLSGRVALDVEWHAKDGNLDRDFAAYRALYDAGIIDCAVLITTHREDLRAWAQRLDPSTKKWMTSTTTNFTKALPRLQRGDTGGCPTLVVALCALTV